VRKADPGLAIEQNGTIGMDVTEEELLAAVRRVLSGGGPGVVVGVGDDAAVVAPGTGELVLTIDALVEGTHFDRRLTSARDLGFKAVAVNVSDIAAMGASPRFGLCGLTLAPDVDAAWTMELFGGMREACDEHALTLVGGNLASGRDITVVVTITGEVAAGRAVTRSGAQPGDAVVVTGTLGASAAGLRLSQQRGAWDERELAAIRRHFRPIARVGEGGLLAAHGATAMIDVSDGLALDLTRLAWASSVGARLVLADVPVDRAATLQEALGGGEDYELLATLPGESATVVETDLKETFGVSLTRIGVIIDEGLVAVEDDGTERPLEPMGWDHFR
jgi:thiamine-monophosphate kinase